MARPLTVAREHNWSEGRFNLCYPDIYLLSTLAALAGSAMLLHQAVRGFELWFGVRPVVTRELFDLLAADIEKT